MWIEISGVRRGFIDLEEMNSLNSQGATNRVALAGGLGNQLFQLAAGLYIAQGNSGRINHMGTRIAPSAIEIVES
jgi:hypothetical protein